MSKYEVELWSKNGVLLADVSTLVKGMSFTLQRNEAEQLQFSLDLQAYEDLCESIGTFPTSILGPYQTDIKIKRSGEYLFGAVIGYIEAEITADSTVLSCRAFGYFNLLIDRYVTETYEGEDQVDIAWDLIDQTQSQTNGDMGITLGAEQTTTTDIDREYVRQNVKDAIIELSQRVGSKFDFEFTYDKEFNTYEMIGSDRSSELQFIYPGNIKEVRVPRDGLSMFNKVTGLGSGFGDEVIEDTQSDNASQLNYGVHEEIVTFNDKATADEVEQATEDELDQRKEIIEIPQMVVNGEDFDLNSYGIGDRVTVRIEQHPFLATVTGVYRIERIEVTVDENDSEDIRLFFDNIDLVEAE